MKIAILGAGAAGLVAARHLCPRHQVTIYEASDRVGGHCLTRLVDDQRTAFAADLGFFSCVPSAYPEFVQLLNRLELPTFRLQTSFHHTSADGSLAYRGSLNAPFVLNRVTVANRRWLGFPLEVVRFWRHARKFLAAPAADHVVGDFLADGNYTHGFVNVLTFHLAAITFGVDRQQLLDLPTGFFLDFVNRFQLLRFSRPGLRGIVGSSQRYIERLSEPLHSRILLQTPIAKLVRTRAGVEVIGADGRDERFDAAVVAVPADQALGLLADPSEVESQVLGTFRYQPTELLFHTDSQALGSLGARRVSVNSLSRRLGPHDDREVLEFHVCVNRLHSIETSRDYYLSRFPSREPDPAQVIEHCRFSHLVVDRQTCWAQQRRHLINGHNRTYYCGAYWGDALHEAAVATGLDVARKIDPAMMVA